MTARKPAPHEQQSRIAGDDTRSYGQNLKPGERSPARYAASAAPSRGREFSEPDCPNRGPFQRDRDRVIHASPFRRLTYKTQVFLFHEGDHYRTRLTHSLEVAQIARTLARQFRLDEDLAEVLALAHDLGHSPFGHAGERALDELMAREGGFDHNAQSLRIVTRLEQKYHGFDGLNLTWETLEGLAKHNGPVTDPNNPVARVAQRLDLWRSLDLATYASAEAQTAALADDIAYANHDIDDGLRAGLLNLRDLETAPLVGPMVLALRDDKSPNAASAHEKTARSASQYDPAKNYIDDSRAIYQLNRNLISFLITDCVEQSRRNLEELRPSSPDDIRNAEKTMIAFSPAVANDLSALKAYLFTNVYRHRKVMAVMDRAQKVVRDLFAVYLERPSEMHTRWATAATDLGEHAKARLVADFVAGMTDRLALMEHARIFDGSAELR